MRGSLFAFGIVSLLFVFSASKKRMPETDGSKEAVILHTVMQVLEQAHFRPQDLDDNFSKAVFKTYLQDLDGSKRFFTQNEIQQLKTFENKLDEDIKARNLDFHHLAVKLFNQALTKSKPYYETAIGQTYNFNGNDIIELDPEKMAYAKNDEELKSYWKKLIQYEIASRLVDRLEVQEKDKTTAAKKSTTDLQIEVREKVKEAYDDYFLRLSKLDEKVWFETYLNAITGYFDPHSNYFSPKEKEDFNMQMSGKYEGIGARLGQEKEYVKVTNIIPGGPAAKNKELEVDDLIIRVTQDGKDPQDVIGMRVDEVVTFIRGKKGTGVMVGVKKKDGTTKEIYLVRDEVILEEGWAKSSFLEIPGNLNKIGYISLPSFYSDFEDNNGKSCSRDVANEIKKLEAGGAKGIILDLRFNGGGSLSEVVEMVGQFIETGPVVQVKSKSGNPTVMQDRDASVVYDGPLVIMSNAYSASASEILAAALQDYKRAVVVGSKSSFGKGTVQRFFPLDRMVNGLNEYKPLGEIKVTVQKFYRINGGSTQLRGVKPDIELTDNYKYLEVGEQEYDHAMEWTEIPKLSYQQSVYVVDNLDQLRSLSKARVDTSQVFKLMDENAMRLKKMRDLTTASLNLEIYRSEESQRHMESEKFNLLNDRSTKLMPTPSAAFSSADIALADKKTLEQRQEEWFRSIKKDAQLEESVMIIQDMIRTIDTKLTKDSRMNKN